MGKSFRKEWADINTTVQSVGNKPGIGYDCSYSEVYGVEIQRGHNCTNATAQTPLQTEALLAFRSRSGWLIK
jgi:hypothetical protein